jgi:hypothetical protein
MQSPLKKTLKKTLLAAAILIAIPVLWLGLRDPDPDDPVWKTPGYEGRTEVELRTAAGAPAQERRVNPSDKDERCVRSGGEVTRELTYDVPSRGLDKTIRDVLRVGAATSFVVCVGPTGKIITVAQSTH